MTTYPIYEVVNIHTGETEREFEYEIDAIDCINFEFSWETHRVSHYIPYDILMSGNFEHR